MRGFLAAVLCGLLAHAVAWPGMKKSTVLTADGESHIGPDCTVGAHGWWPEAGPCPNMAQPSPPPSTGIPPHPIDHVWPDAYMVDWKFYFVMDNNDVPPYTPEPSSPFNVTTGRTYYHHNATTGLTNMRESYDQYCIPVFGDPSNPMGAGNHYSCEFLNVATTNTSYVLLFEDRPPGTPECCIIGQPFHAPPPNFRVKMPMQWSSRVEGNIVDWNAVYDKDAGIFSYGFDGSNEKMGVPFAFYMKGVPWIANWMWQRFDNFRADVPPADTWTIPSACASAVRCPGW